jgi:hypothetical protein
LCDVKIIAKFAPNFAKLVENYTRKAYFSKISQICFDEKKKKFAQNKNTG